MKKVAVVYWSGTGNTEKMADCIAQGAKAKDAQVDMFTSNEFSKDMVGSYQSIAFGCPSMGSEVLEESAFQPMWDNVRHDLSNKKIVLFGSYGWGDGEWMRTWADEAGIEQDDTYICCGEPTADHQVNCKNLGEKLA